MLTRYAMLVLLAVPLSSAGEVYSWIDTNGKRHFSDQPPPDQSVQDLQKRDYQLHNIDESYPAGILVDEGREEREQQGRALAIERARKMQEACLAAREDLATIKGRVIFTDDDGREVHVSEDMRRKMAADLQAEIKARCGG